MFQWIRKQLSTIEGFLSKFPGFRNGEKHSISFLNGAQFFGALNDNIYKLVLIFYLIQLQGAQHSNTILSLAGAIFVIPFLLFSSAAGILADRYSKSRIIILVKANEILVLLLAFLGFLFKISWGSYAILFLLAAQSAMFGPSKYGIIPELVPKDKVSKANGVIVSFTYLAIISGTFLASFLTEITHKNYIVVAIFCLFLAILGFLCSFGIKYTPPRGTKKKIDIFFFKQIYHTLVECRLEKHLLISIFGSSYFLFIGGFTQLNVIPFAMESLGLTEIAGGYLFLTTALGIALGAYLAGKASRSVIELGLTCLAGIVISAFFFILSYSANNTPLAIAAMFLIGFSGGCFIVPFDSFIQLQSPENTRGHVIAASNFLSFVGVLLASFALYLFNEVLRFTSAESFAVMGWITLAVTIFLIIRISDLFLSYTSRKILHKLFRVRAENLRLVKSTHTPLLMLEDGSFMKAWLLAGFIPNMHLLVPQYKKRSFPWFERFFFSIHRIESPQKFETLINQGKHFIDPQTIPCIYLMKKKPVPERQTFTFMEKLKRKQYNVLLVNFEKTNKQTLIRFSK